MPKHSANILWWNFEAWECMMQGVQLFRYFTKHDNVAMLRMALGLGFDIIGMQYKTQERFAQVILERDITPSDRE